MKGFVSYLRRAERKDAPDDWSRYYINYALLKDKLKQFTARRKAWKNRGDIEYSTDLLVSAATEDNGYLSFDSNSNKDPVQALQLLATAERNDFIATVELELQTCATFVQDQLNVLKTSLAQVSREQLTIQKVAMETLEVFHFIVTNIVTLRQILLRFNAFRRSHEASPVGEWDLRYALLLFDLEPLAQIEATITLYQMSRQLHDELAEFMFQYEQFRLLLDSSLQSVERAAGGHIVVRDVVRDRILSTVRQNFLMGSVRFGLSLEPSFLIQKGRHLKQEMRSLAKWRATKTLPPPAHHHQDSKTNNMDPKNIWPLVLNLSSCFLFMMNNYIIEPSSAYYANALGSSDALSGIMIGAASWFALVSAVAYSFWTNYSYKKPIVFAGVLMVIGNLLYASAYSYKSLELCLIGRAICGLGAPRVINRRYVADATPFSLRTAASSAFAMATALGAALGPGMAIVLNLYDFEFSLPLFGKQYFNGMTGPGYFMAVSWLVYTLLVIFSFQEPNRSGLEELREREDREREEDYESEEVASENTFADDDDLSVDGDNNQNSEADEPSLNSPRYCIKHITRATALCMAIIFMKRVALEAIVGSTSIITKNRYSWTITNVGTLHLVNGLIVIPVSVMAGWLSQYYEDRYLAMWLLAITMFGMMFMVDLTDLVDHHSNDSYNDEHWLSVGPGRYIAASLIAFSGIEACESFVASLMSKVVPSALAVGTFNSGLLATLVGTSGRATGDLFITLMGLISIRNLLNLLIIPGICLLLISMIVLRRNYAILAV